MLYVIIHNPILISTTFPNIVIGTLIHTKRKERDNRLEEINFC